jgi:hypothetical protein
VRARMLAVAVVALTLNAATASAARDAAPRFSPEALLAADVPWATVQAVAGTSFWPRLPAFNSIVDEEDPQPLTAVSQAYGQLGGRTSIVTRLYAYSSPEISLEFLQSNAIVVERIDQQLPDVGDQHFYFVTTLAGGAPSTRLFFIRGPFGVEIQVDDARWSKGRMGQLAAPIDRALQLLVAGKLRAPAIPAGQLAHLPAAALAPGPVLGTASVPAEAWAMVVHKGSPRAIRASLVSNGDATIPFRRYLRRGSHTDVIEVTLFSFPSTGAARSWFAPFAAGVRRHPADALDAGATGKLSAFRFQLDNYELQFVAGRHVADVFCWAPFVADASTACEDATRTLAERWYGQLSR